MVRILIKLLAIRLIKQNTLAKSLVMLQLQCNRAAASDRREIRDENQAMKSNQGNRQMDSSRVRREREGAEQAELR